jgi:queuine/archaeosine tRNA-ribosyltransferase
MPSRTLRIGSMALDLPQFIPSVSSLRSQLFWAQYVEVLSAVRAPTFLVSAYDFHYLDRQERADLIVQIGSARKAGSLLVLDSGGYEASWLGREWKHSWYAESAVQLAPDLLFTFDDPSHDPDDPYEHVLADLARDSEILETTVVPIVHGTIEGIVETCGKLAQLGPPMIAVAERKLGAGIKARIDTVRKIRMSIGMDSPVPLHLLGTGDPKSILAYAHAGADSFDAVDWSQFVFDPVSTELLPPARSDWIVPFDADGRSERLPTVLVHNLSHYASWMESLRHELSGGVTSLAVRWLPAEFAQADKSSD